MPKPMLKANNTASPAPEKAKPTFLESLRLIDRAGYGVVLLRTREPVRAINVLKDFTFLRKNPETNELDSKFRVWDCVNGWVDYPCTATYEGGTVSLEEGDRAIVDSATEVAAALGLVQDVPNMGKNPWPTGIYVFNYPHKQIADSEAFIVTLKRYCHSLPTGRSRVILVVPPSFSMPPELEDDITLLDFVVPSQKELTERFDTLLEELGKTHSYSTDDIAAITSAGLGMTELDFDQAVALAIAQEGDSKSPAISSTVDEFLATIYRCKTEAVKRTNMLELIDPVSPENLGGMDNVKQWAKKRQSWFGPKAAAFKLKAPKGALAVGLPGTGKSLLCRVLGSLFRMAIVRFDISKVFGKYVGESEGKMGLALDFIMAIAPVVVWVDEIDKAGLSGESANESSKRVLGKLLTAMQEAPRGVFFIFTANRPDSLPPELLRPGRLNITFGVVLPNPTERLDVFKIHLRNGGQDWRKVPNLDVAITASEGYTGAEIEEAVNNAIGELFDENTPITGETLAAQIKFIKPQSQSHKQDYDKVIQWCKQNAIPASADDAKSEGRETVQPTQKKAVRRIGG